MRNKTQEAVKSATCSLCRGKGSIKNSAGKKQLCVQCRGSGKAQGQYITK